MRWSCLLFFLACRIKREPESRLASACLEPSAKVRHSKSGHGSYRAANLPAVKRCFLTRDSKKAWNMTNKTYKFEKHSLKVLELTRFLVGRWAACFHRHPPRRPRRLQPMEAGACCLGPPGAEPRAPCQQAGWRAKY